MRSGFHVYLQAVIENTEVMKMNLPVVLSGIVVHGNHIGTGLGMPTANIYPKEDAKDIEHGVFISTVETDGKTYRAITNLGKKPTVKDDGEINAESYIYDFSSDLYGKEIKVTLLRFQRPEMKFSSLGELKLQMKKDIEEGRTADLSIAK